MVEARPKRKNRRQEPARPFLRRWAIYFLFLAAAGLLAAGGLAVYTSKPAADHNHLLVTIGQGFVRDAIRNELRTSFSTDEETQVQALPNRRYRVSGWVDVVAEDGEHRRQTFSCVIYKNDSDDWAGENISVIPQEI